MKRLVLHHSRSLSTRPEPAAPISAAAQTTKVDLLGLTSAEIKQVVAPLEFKHGFVGTQIHSNVYRTGRTSFMSMTNISLRDRAVLSDRFRLGFASERTKQVSKDGTIKWLLGFDGNDGVADSSSSSSSIRRGGKAEIETVWIPQVARHQAEQGLETGTACVSSQVGCSLACSFCHTGTQRMLRNLSAGEIVAQVLHVMRSVGDLPPDPSTPAATSPPDTLTAPHSTAPSNHKSRRLTNIVFMGQGEPLYNFKNVSSAVRTINQAFSFAPWRTTISTSGVVPLMGAIAKDLQASLAVSLHAVRDDLRNELVPLNKQYNLHSLMHGVRDYLAHTKTTGIHRRVTFEYVMLNGVNDSDAEARDLVKLLHCIPAHVNLIPFNTWPGAAYTCSPDQRISEFRDIIRKRGIECHTRISRGNDILAACGQLKSLVGPQDSKTKFQKLVQAIGNDNLAGVDKQQHQL
eukprot:jgi/Hompol1/1522/HPOL_003446-RA